jgi:hypothetical protein
MSGDWSPVPTKIRGLHLKRVVDANNVGAGWTRYVDTNAEVLSVVRVEP